MTGPSHQAYRYASSGKICSNLSAQPAALYPNGQKERLWEFSLQTDEFEWLVSWGRERALTFAVVRDRRSTQLTTHELFQNYLELWVANQPVRSSKGTLDV